MGWYIKGIEDEGLFVGECMGLGFFESHIKSGFLSQEERPIRFPSREEADRYLKSWIGGRQGCEVVFIFDSLDSLL